MIRGVQDTAKKRQPKQPAGVNRRPARRSKEVAKPVDDVKPVEQTTKSAESARPAGRRKRSSTPVVRGDYNAPDATEQVVSEPATEAVEPVVAQVFQEPIKPVKSSTSDFAEWKHSCPVSHVKLNSKLARLSIGDDYHDLDDDIAFNQEVMQMFSEDDRGDLVPSILREGVVKEEPAPQPVEQPVIEPAKVAEVITEPAEDVDEEFDMI